MRARSEPKSKEKRPATPPLTTQQEYVIYSVGFCIISVTQIGISQKIGAQITHSGRLEFTESKKESGLNPIDPRTPNTGTRLVPEFDSVSSR